MLRRSCILSAAALMLPLSALTLSSPASALDDPVSRVVLEDPTGDVWAIGEGEDEEWAPAGDVPSADVVRAVVRHRRYKVVVKMTFADLGRVEPQHYVATISSRRRYGAVFVSAGPRAWNGRHELVDGNFSRVRCPGLRHSIDYETDRVTMSVPRACIGRPDWVRVGMTNYMFRGATEEDLQEVTDNPHSAEVDGPPTRRLHRPHR